MKLYTIIEFKSEQGAVDCVPNKWIFVDNIRKKLQTHFIPPPYTNEKCKEFHKIVRNQEEPASDWPAYDIDIIGESDDYDDALNELQQLKKNKYGFTTDCEEDEAVKEIYKIKEEIIEKSVQYKEKTDVEMNSSSSSSGNSDTGETKDRTRSTTIHKGTTQNIIIIEKNVITGTGAKPKIISIDKYKKELKVKGKKEVKYDDKKKDDKTSEQIDQIKDDHVLHLVLRKLADIQFEIENIKKYMVESTQSIHNKIDEALSQKNIENFTVQNPYSTWTAQEKFKLPFSSMDEFKDFCRHLKNDENYQIYFACSMDSDIDKTHSLFRNIGTILKKIFKKDLMIKFTAVKQIARKALFCETYFYSFLYSIFTNKANRKKILNFTQAEFNRALGNVISSASRWSENSTSPYYYRRVQARATNSPAVHIKVRGSDGSVPKASLSLKMTACRRVPRPVNTRKFVFDFFLS